MIATTIQQEKSIIQIELFKHQFFSTKELVQMITIVLVILLIANLIFYYFLNSADILINLNLFFVGIILLISILPYKYLFQDVDTILIIAFDEFQFMKDNKILWCEKVEQIEFIKSDKTPAKIPIITIKSKSFQAISIGYGRPKTSKSKSKIDYLTFSKLDWRILKHYQKINS